MVCPVPGWGHWIAIGEEGLTEGQPLDRGEGGLGVGGLEARVPGAGPLRLETLLRSLVVFISVFLTELGRLVPTLSLSELGELRFLSKELALLRT